MLNRLIRHAYTTFAPYTPVHTPVMLNEVLTHLAPKAGGIYCDLTFGDGGYTKAILDSSDCKVVALDQDPTAYDKACQMADTDAYRGRLFPLLGRFGQIEQSVRERLGWGDACFDGMVMDIGVSSGQLETASRGFSYRLDGPLDMRMFSRGQQTPAKFDDETKLLHKSVSAYEVVNFFAYQQLADIIHNYGGDRLARKIAARIVAARQKAPIETTTELAGIIQRACPQPRWHRGDDDVLRNSAARTFQALRIYINDELTELKSALGASEHLLQPHGRLVVVTFHSLEDRIAKTFLQHCSGRRSIQDADANPFRLKRAGFREKQRALLEETDRGEVYEVKSENKAEQDTAAPSFKLCMKGVVCPTPEELATNPRSRSAKLRAAQRTDASPMAPFEAILR